MWEVVRLARELGVPMLFLEHVDNFRFLTYVWKAVVMELLYLDFNIR